MSENSTNIAVIGLGAMGLPMATHLATAFSVTGFDPFEPRRQLAAEHGIVAEATPEGASKNAEIALLAVRDQGQAESALFGEDGVIESLRPGSPVILTSTIGPEAARAWPTGSTMPGTRSSTHLSAAAGQGRKWRSPHCRRSVERRSGSGPAGA